jgi:hypothetical protein
MKRGALAQGGAALATLGRGRVLLLVLLVLMGSGGVARAAAPSTGAAYAEELVREAERRKLAEDETWLRLGHYRRTLFGGFESEADGEPFFIAPEGKTHPDAELRETLRGFALVKPKDGLEHPLCRFPARRLWLERVLKLDPARLPHPACPRFEEFMTRLAPESLTVVFSSYYLNNPASAFGHTFLRVSRAHPGKSGESTELLDYGVDFSAVVDTGNAILYAFKGMAGLFPGTFHKVPLYYKVREYNDYESRDLWEYELNLDHDQVRFVTAHLWELGSTYFAYYYLSENCSYQILGALEVADPRLKLVSHAGWPVIPAETVKALLKNSGLVSRIHYRPSNRTRVRDRLGALDSDELDAVAKLVSDPHAPFAVPLTRARQVVVIDAAIELMGVKMARDLAKERPDMDAERLETEQVLLERRASYATPSEEPRFTPPFRQMPHLGHGATRLGLGSGFDRAAGLYHTAHFRLALHDLADPARGYPDGAEIDFLPVGLRYYLRSPRVTLEELSLIRVRSLSAWSRFDHSLSWMVDAGSKRLYDRRCNGCYVGFGQVGGGVTVEPFGRFLTLFALAEAELATPVRHGYWDFLRLAVGPWGGLRLRLGDQVAALVTGSWSYLPFQKPDRTWSLDGKLRAAYTRDLALGIEGRIDETTRSVQGVSYFYF